MISKMHAKASRRKKANKKAHRRGVFAPDGAFFVGGRRGKNPGKSRESVRTEGWNGNNWASMF